MGTGGVGKVPAAGFTATGREVMIGTCDPASCILSGWLAQAGPGDAIALLSNGAFGGIHTKLLDALS